jgi:hypothetical protein
MYDFKDLSPIDFEELVRDLLQKKLGISLESFKPGKDRGIDFRYSIGGASTIIQAKHYLRSGDNALVSAAAKENKKVKALLPKRYIFVTSLPMSDSLKARIIAALPDAPLVKKDIIGQEDLNGYLSEFPDVEKTHFKLWLGSTSILEKIINSGVYNRTETELALIGDMVPKFVQNDSVGQAEKILERDGTLIIAGDPGVGKTTLARILVSLHIAQEWELHVVSDMEEAFRVATKGTKKLVFFDDFLGQVRLSADHVRGLDQRLPPFLSRVQDNKDLRFILTTRELILNQAQLLSQRLASRQVTERKYILDVGKYTREVKARILYNHIYFSSLNGDQIDSIIRDDFFLKIIDHQNFNPRLIDILTREDYQVISGEPLKDAMSRILANPEDLWARPYRDHISPDGRSVMLALLLSPPTVSLANLRATFGRVSAALDLSFPAAQAQMRFAAALKELEGAVLSIASRTVRFSNPGVRDFLQVAVLDDGVLPSIVEQVETYDEIRQAWIVFRTQKDFPLSPDKGVLLWLGALQRMLDGEASNPVERLDLALEIFDSFGDSSAMLDVVLAAGDQLQATQLDEDDVSAIRNMLETVILHSLPMDVSYKLQKIVTDAACNLLVNCAGNFSFEDIKYLDEALQNYGTDAVLFVSSVSFALDAFVSDLDSELSNFSTVDEIDEFEEELTELLQKRAISIKYSSEDLAEKRQAIRQAEFEREGEDRYTSGGESYQAVREASSEAIRSMFGVLSVAHEGNSGS